MGAGMNPGVNPETERLLSVKEAAGYAGVHGDTIYRWIYAGKLRASRIRGRVKTSLEALSEVDAPEPIPLADPPPTPARRRREVSRVNRYLEGQGW